VASEAGSTGTVAAVTVDAVAQPAAARHRAVVVRVLRWYAGHARDLPWRRPEATPWQVMVSEFMLQQTPVERVRGPWQTWVDRWPSPAALAAAPPGDAVRAWGRLGYPRRALRLHRAAVTITEEHDGEVPADREALLRLPGVGAYTAAAIASFAFGRREVVLDTNVRRVLARVDGGVAGPAPSQSVAELAAARAFLPGTPARAARWAVAVMELGALVCVARAPRCAACPVQDLCAWRAAGYPAAEGRARRAQSYGGSDRQCRGALLAVLRSSEVPVTPDQLATAWPDAAQRRRCLHALHQDGLAVTTAGGWVALPG